MTTFNYKNMNKILILFIYSILVPEKKTAECLYRFSLKNDLIIILNHNYHADLYYLD